MGRAVDGGLAEVAPRLARRLRVRRSGTSSWDFERDVLRLGRDNADESRFAHELQHVWFTIGTPYGQFVSELALLRRACAQQYLDLQEGPVPYPAYDLARIAARRREGLLRRIGIDPDRFSRSVVPVTVRPWSHARFLELLLEAEDAASTASSTAPNAVRALQVVEAAQEGLFYAPGNSPPELAAVEAGPAGSVAAPWLRAPRGQRVFVGGFTVMEGVAQLVEGVAAAPGAHVGYSLLLAWMLARAGPTVYLDGARVRGVIRTLLCLAELALYTPLGLLYGRLRRPGISWADVHPGHRFMRAASFLPTGRIVGTSHADYVNLQREVCTRFGWPAPDDFHQVAAGLSGSEFPSESFDRHLAAMAARATRPRIWVAESARDVPRLRRLFRDQPPLVVDDSGAIRPSPDLLAVKSREFAVITALHGVMTAQAPFWPRRCMPNWLGPRTRAVIREELERSWLDPQRFVCIRCPVTRGDR